MKRFFLLVFGIVLTLLPAKVLHGKSPDEMRRLYEHHSESRENKSSQFVESYKSHRIFEDSTADQRSEASSGKPEPKDSADAIDTLVAQDETETTYMLELDTIVPFGYDMFIERSADFAPPEISTVPPDYKIGPGDNLLVNLWGRVDMELDLTVNREGKVFIPKVGDIVCYGLSLTELQNRLKRRISEVYSDFKLSVSLGKIHVIRVYVYGEVKQPGGYTLSSLSTLFNALYAARGPNERGSMRKVRLLRGGKTIKQIDLYSFLLNGNLSGNVKLESEDVVFVPLAGELIKVRGEVKRPAIYELLGGETVEDVITLAGSMKPNAYTSRVMVDRIGENDSRVVLDLDLSNPDLEDKQTAIKGGDEITVFSMDEVHENVVWLSGYVKHPGAYQLEERSNISDLIFCGDQLYDDVYMQRADLIRTNQDSRQEIISVNLEAITDGDSSADLRLQAKDELIVYAASEVTRKKFVTIKGEVAYPGVYPLYENMKLSDLIFKAGNLNRNAFLLSAEIARLTQDGTTELLYVDLKKIIDEKDSSYDITLAEDDQVFIRSIPDWETDRTVTVKGEVKFPGEYVISHENETLYDLIQRAGGLTDKAFPRGAVFTRTDEAEHLQREDLQGIIAKSAPLIKDSTGTVYSDLSFAFNPDRMNRIVIDLEKALLSGHNGGNLTLRPGDRIFVPEAPSGVQVMGAVAASGTIHFEANKKPSYYIERAGGLLRNSDKNGR